MGPTKVAIIDAGEWGSLRHANGDYSDFVKHLERAAGGARRWEGSTTSPAADVKVVASVDEARSWLGGDGVAIFISRGMVRAAKALASAYPRMHVILFTGLVPEGEVVFIDKRWFEPRFLERIIESS